VPVAAAAETENTAADPAVALIAEGEKIGGLEIQNGLKRLDNDHKTWIKIVRTFTETTPGLLEIMQNSIPGNLKKYSVTVHGIKSVCSGIGAREAGERAKELEDCSEAGDLAFVTEKNPDFIMMITRLVDDLRGLLDKITEEKPLKEKPDGTLLQNILEACENYDMGLLEENMAEIEKNNYNEGEELVQWLRKQCDCSDFSAIRERLVLNLNKPV